MTLAWGNRKTPQFSTVLEPEKFEGQSSGYGGGEGGVNPLLENPSLFPPYPEAMPWVGTGHATYFWVIQ
jgi:hypothetical protein